MIVLFISRFVLNTMPSNTVREALGHPTSRRAFLPRHATSFYLGEVVGHLGGSEHPELFVLSHNADLDVVR